jgi:hypothetical protein
MTDQTPEPQAARLAEAYDACLLGALVDLHAPPRFVYSLRKLILFEMKRTGNPAQTCREEVATWVIGIQREHGPLSPAFVDDELLKPVEDPGPKIIVPGANGFRHPPKKR